MKIAFVTSYFGTEIDGASQVIKELGSRLIKEGHDVHVYAPAWDKKKRIPTGEEIIDNIKVHRCFYWFKVANFATFWPSVFFKIKKEKFDIVHTHISGHPHVFFATLAAKMTKSKIIHTTHAPWTDSNRPWLGKILTSLSYNTITRWSYKMTDHIIAISKWETPMIEKYGGKEKITFIPNGVNDLFFKTVKPNNFKKDNKINKKIILFFGRLDRIKGPEFFVKAANIILSKRKDLTFLLVGPDEGMKSELLNLVNNKEIIFMDAIKDRNKVVEMLQSASVLVMPSYREGSPLTLFEAMASKLPIVASDIPGISTILVNKENGLLCAYADYESIANSILMLVDNKKLSKNIINNNLKLVKEYSWNNIYRKTIELYN